ncbi:acyltransferase family protein [Flavilitoribacter nigricans]|uniref:Acyltransferase n=1 Tax=Flavilitoribacter nigricans (strain ATCC 23147 / DSM 23189 / NBRC 102662 / NCIMB 1420 / SS-2) TaxID=1122177 RepID=A0A2D0NHV4_FLAN2|nr:acyltransferase [Flavilitoribacter nigricans]PHN07749.1 acyltransferase [Flavilitoribacter nigricans DSM 23189 = NBRC 102662]
MNRNTRPDRNVGIDILRGVSILAVILLHLNLRLDFKQTLLGAALPRQWFSLFFWSGFHGVALFFVISGYLITHSALKKWGSLPSVSPRQFYLYRFARIMPLLGLLLLVLAVLHLLQVPNFRINPEKVSLGRAVFAALTFHFNWLEIQVGYLPGNWDVLWSLSIEETFYLFFPLVCLLARKEWHFVAIVSVFFLISPWARTALYPDNELGDRNHLAYIDAIAMGCLAALVARRITIPQKWLNTLMVIGWGLLIFVFFFKRTVFQLGLTKNGLYITLLALGGALVLLWMHHRHADGKQKRLPGLNWLAHLGQYSYEIYLTHMFVVVLITYVYQRFEVTGSGIYLLFLVGIGLSYLLGSLVANYFSDPVNSRLRKKWISRERTGEAEPSSKTNDSLQT